MDLLQHTVPMSIAEMGILLEELKAFQWLCPTERRGILIQRLESAIAAARQKEEEYARSIACH